MDSESDSAPESQATTPGAAPAPAKAAPAPESLARTPDEEGGVWDADGDDSPPMPKRPRRHSGGGAQAWFAATTAEERSQQRDEQQLPDDWDMPAEMIRDGPAAGWHVTVTVGVDGADKRGWAPRGLLTCPGGKKRKDVYGFRSDASVPLAVRQAVLAVLDRVRFEAHMDLDFYQNPNFIPRHLRWATTPAMDLGPEQVAPPWNPVRRAGAAGAAGGGGAADPPHVRLPGGTGSCATPDDVAGMVAKKIKRKHGSLESLKAPSGQSRDGVVCSTPAPRGSPAPADRLRHTIPGLAERLAPLCNQQVEQPHPQQQQPPADRPKHAMPGPADRPAVQCSRQLEQLEAVPASACQLLEGVVSAWYSEEGAGALKSVYGFIERTVPPRSASGVGVMEHHVFGESDLAPEQLGRIHKGLHVTFVSQNRDHLGRWRAARVSRCTAAGATRGVDRRRSVAEILGIGGPTLADRAEQPGAARATADQRLVAQTVMRDITMKAWKKLRWEATAPEILELIRKDPKFSDRVSRELSGSLKSSNGEVWDELVPKILKREGDYTKERRGLGERPDRVYRVRA